MKLGIVLSTTEPETMFNVLRLGNHALSQGDTVRVFLLGKGVELDQIKDERFDVRQQAESLLKPVIIRCVGLLCDSGGPPGARKLRGMRPRDHTSCEPGW